MEVRPGYKQTEVGVIPIDWEVRRLGELASVSAGGTPSRANTHYWDGNIPWVTTSEVDFYTITHADQFITKEGLNNSPAKLLPPGTLLMALYGQGKTRGKIGILGIEAATNQACAAISLNRSVSPDFIFHFLASQYEAIRKLSNSGSQENLNGSLVRSISILLPPLPEQRAIGEALSDVDGLLGALDQLIAKKRDLKQAAMQQLLTGQTRLPGFASASQKYKQTEMGVIPEEWECTRMSEIAKLESGHTPSKREPSYWGGSIPWISLFDTEGLQGREIFETAKMVTEEGLNNSSARLLPKGTVVFSRTATVGKTTVMGREMATSQDFANYICGPKLHNHFLVYLFRSMGRTWKGLMAGSIHNTIYMPVFKALQIIQPPLPEQTAIAEVLTEMDAELAVLEQRREKTRALKQGMMQELLTGRTRLVALPGATA